MILAIACPWMCVLGGVFLAKVVIQPLTDYVWLGGDPFDPTRQVFGARLFTALKPAISSLAKYYKALEADPHNSTISCFSFIAEYGAENIKFMYSSCLIFDNSFLYKATLHNM